MQKEKNSKNPGVPDALTLAPYSGYLNIKQKSEIFANLDKV